MSVLILTIFYSGVHIHHVDSPSMEKCEAAAVKWLAAAKQDAPRNSVFAVCVPR
jgi:hypothetical protein